MELRLKVVSETLADDEPNTSVEYYPHHEEVGSVVLVQHTLLLLKLGLHCIMILLS